MLQYRDERGIGRTEQNGLLGRMGRGGSDSKYKAHRQELRGMRTACRYSSTTFY